MAISNQQQRCIFYLSQGMTSKEIGTMMRLSPRTVEYYISIVREKTGLKRKSELVKWFLLAS